MRLVTASLLGLLVAAPLLAQEPQQPQQEREREHTVRRGDTLWDLAGHYLANPFRWPSIHEANTRIVANPHWIYPDQVLVIPGLREARAMPDDARPGAAPTAQRPTATPARQVVQQARTLFYREPPPRADRPTLLIDPLSERVPVKPGEFYRAEFLADADALPVAGRVVRPLREVDQTSDVVASAHPFDEVYVSYATPQPPAVGDQFLIADVGRFVPDAGLEIRVIDPRAVVVVVGLDDEVMRVRVEEQFGRVLRGQVMLPLDHYPAFSAPSAEPVAGAFDLEGRLMELVDDSPLPGRLARGFIDMGSARGVQVGDVFEAYLPARPARQRDRGAHASTIERVPAERVAELRVVRVTDASATVVVDRLARPQLADGLPVRRIRRMP